MNFKKVEPKPPPEKSEWSPIKDRPYWYLHRDGVRKAYNPPDPEPAIDIVVDATPYDGS